MNRLFLFAIFSVSLLVNCTHKEIDVKTRFLIEKKYKSGISYLNRGLSEPAQKELLEAIMLNHDDARLHSALGRSYLISKKYDAALSEFNTAIELDSQFTEAYFYMGNLYMLIKKWDDAISQYEKVLEFPFFEAAYNLYNSLGLAYYEKGNYELAIEKFKKSTEFRFDFPIVHYNLGLTYLQMGNIASAIEEYKKAITFLPDYVEAYHKLGLIYLKKGDTAKAREKFDYVVKLAPNSNIAQEAKKYLALIK